MPFFKREAAYFIYIIGKLLRVILRNKEQVRKLSQAVEQSPVSIIIIVMIVGALYFALRPKKWETAEQDFSQQHDEFAEIKDD